MREGAESQCALNHWVIDLNEYPDDTDHEDHEDDAPKPGAAEFRLKLLTARECGDYEGVECESQS
jgi:hypothetical protein